MAEMLIQTVLHYLDADESLLANDKDAYNSYTVPDDIVVQMVPPGNDDPEWYTVTYVQVVSATDNEGNVIAGPLVVICQLEGLPEDPINLQVDNALQVKIFKQVV